MNKNKQLVINLITTLCVLIVNIGISFGLSRYIVSTIGEEAYGFVSLANNFVMYATIFTTALNSMASRFVTINIHRGNIDSANKYFSSVLIANVIVISVLIIPAIVMIGYLEHIVNISTNIVTDVKLLFTFIILNFFVSLIGGVFSIATYCTNKLYLTSIKNMESMLIKCLIIVGLFILFQPAVFYVGLATLIAGIFVFIYNIKFTKQLLPDIKVKKSNFSWKKIKELVSSGIWNSVTNLGNVLADGLDLLISNLAIGGSAMGIVALAKTPANAINTVINGISNVFQPQIISFYSKDDTAGVLREAKQGMKITGMFGNIPFAYILVFGLACCFMWMPDVDVQLLYILCAITFINIFGSGVASPLYNIFTITNRVKGNAIMNISFGALSTIIVLILINVSELGVFAIVGVSATLGIIKEIIIIPIYAAHCLNVKWNTFMPTIIRYCISTAIMVVTYLILSKFVIINTWIMLFASIIICGIIGLIVNYVFLFNNDDRKRFLEITVNKFRKN